MRLNAPRPFSPWRRLQMYQVPRYAFSTPSNLVSDAEFSKLNHARRKPHVGVPIDTPVICRVSSTANTIEQDVRLVVLSNTTVRTGWEDGVTFVIRS